MYANDGREAVGYASTAIGATINGKVCKKTWAWKQ